MYSSKFQKVFKYLRVKVGILFAYESLFTKKVKQDKNYSLFYGSLLNQNQLSFFSIELYTRIFFLTYFKVIICLMKFG